MVSTVARLSLLAVVAAALAIGGCDDSDQDSSDASSEPFQACNFSGAGGHDVWVQGMDCSDVTTKRLLSMPSGFGRYKSLPEAKRIRTIQAPNGWTCWEALEGDYGPIHNVCRHGDATLIFYLD